MSQSKSGTHVMSQFSTQPAKGKSSSSKFLAIVGVVIAAVGAFSFWYTRQGDPGVTRYNEATADIAAGNVADAEKALITGTNEDPKYAPCFIQLGALYVQQHRFPDALKAYQRAVQLRPSDGSVWLALGSLYSELHQLDPAADASKRAADLMPNDADAQAQYGLIQDRRGKIDDAYGYYRKAHDLRPASPEFLITMCRFGLAEPFSPDQITYQEGELAKYLQANPTDVDAAQVMVQTEGRLPPSPDRLASGIRYGNMVLAAHPTDVPTRLVIAQLYLSSNRVTDARDNYIIALKTDPKSREGLHGLLVCYTRLGQNQLAATVAKQLQQLPAKPAPPTTGSG